MCSRVVACGALFGMGFVRFFFLFINFFFLNLCMSCYMWGSIWGGICPIFLFIIIFFSEFVYGLLLVCGWLLSQFFFFNYSCLIKLGPYEIEVF
jgi:hypothetical protein